MDFWGKEANVGVVLRYSAVRNVSLFQSITIILASKSRYSAITRGLYWIFSLIIGWTTRSPPKKLEKGGYHCRKHKCINKNKAYPNLNSAWDACGKVSECKRIMKHDGKFFLRRGNDNYDPNPALKHVDFQCQGKFRNHIVSFILQPTYHTVLSNVVIIYLLFF